MPSLHPTFWLKDGTHIFHVGDKFYKLHASILSNASLTLQDMFSVDDQHEGLTVEAPIVLQQISEAMFDEFLNFVYGRWRPPPYENDVLQILLQSACHLQCQGLMEFAVHNIHERRFHFHPTTLISLSVQYSIEKIFHSAFRRLVETPLHELTQDQLNVVPINVYVAYTRVCEAVWEHYRILACEPPRIYTHLADCHDFHACERDWRAVWWNGMGRFLLDGRNPQTWTEALDQFKTYEFGAMGVGCKRSMLEFIGEHQIKRHETNLIDSVSSALAVALKLQKPLV